MWTHFPTRINASTLRVLHRRIVHIGSTMTSQTVRVESSVEEEIKLVCTRGLRPGDTQSVGLDSAFALVMQSRRRVKVHIIILTFVNGD
jgi:hypothetical protein